MAKTIKFWQGMQRVVTIDGQDKLMIGKNSTGEAQYVNVEDLNQLLSIAGIEIAPVSPGALPSGPSGVSRTMQLLNAGTWTFGGNSFVNPSGSIMKLWWNGYTWSLGGLVSLPKGADGIDGASLLEIWSSTSPNYPYKINVQVRDSVGKTFVSLVSNNTFALSDATKWKPITIDLVDNLTSTANDKALSANQGRFLNSQFSLIKTYNKFNKEAITKNKQVNQDTGAIITGTSIISDFIEVLADTLYKIIGTTTNYRVFFYKEDKTYISYTSTTLSRVFTTPAETKFVIFYVKEEELDTVMLIEGSAVKEYIPYGLPRNTQNFAFKSDVVKKSEVSQNENIFYHNLLDKNGINQLGFVNATRILNLENEDVLRLRYGIDKYAEPSLNVTALTFNFSLRVLFSARKLPKYVYFECIVSSNVDKSFFTFTTRMFQGVLASNGVGQNASSIEWSNIESIGDNLYKINACAKMQQTADCTALVLGFNKVHNTQDFFFKYYAPCYHISDIFYNDIVLLKEINGVDKRVINQSVYATNQVKSASFYIDSLFRGKKVTLFGSSIEYSNYFAKVAEVFEMNYVNEGLGGSNICFADNTVDAGIIYNNMVTNARLAFSCTQAEKEAYCNPKGITLIQADLDVCYDNSLLGNLDSDYFIFGTYGINDRKSGDTRAYIIDKVNRKYDRTTIYGAYCYVLRKLFEAKPDAKVIILGQHTFGIGQWLGMDRVHEIQREVAKDWKLRFFDMAYHLGMSTEVINIGGIDTSVNAKIYTTDGAHLTDSGKLAIANYLIRALTSI